MPICIGIDLGTTYSCVGVWDKDHVRIIQNDNGNCITPSFVSFGDEICVGESAKDKSVSDPENTIYMIKRFMGRKRSDIDVLEDIENVSYEVLEDKDGWIQAVVKHKGSRRRYRPEEISAMILREMKRIAEAALECEIENAVITVPAYFDDTQRTATKNAAIIAGLKCCRIINEPTAACLCYGIDKKERSNVLVYDLGGGTFDVSVLKLTGGVFQVLSTCGDTHLGGEDFDNMLIKFIMERIFGINPDSHEKILNDQRLLKIVRNSCIKAKHALSGTKSTMIYIDVGSETHKIQLSRTAFEMYSKELFDKCMDPVNIALTDAGLKPEDIQDVVLVGGSTRIPKIRELLAAKFGRDKLNFSVNPDEAVAYGAAIQGAILSGEDESGKTSNLLLLDVIPLSLGVETKNGVMSKIINRNTTIPIVKNKVYSTVSNNQSTVEITVFEGEREFVKNNRMLAKFTLGGIPPAPCGVPRIKVSFAVDENGILNVSASDLDTGGEKSITINNSDRLTDNEIKEMVSDAAANRACDEMMKESMILKEKFEEFLYSVQKVVNDPVFNTDEMGNSILTDEEVSFVNQYVLNSINWLMDETTMEDPLIIESSMRNVEKNLKQYTTRLWTRQEQVRMKNEIREESIPRTEEELREILREVFGE